MYINRTIIHRVRKKGATLFLPVTPRNSNRFSKFALYIDDICNSVSLCQGCYIILYAGDILLISPSVSTLEQLLHTCEIELIYGY